MRGKPRDLLTELIGEELTAQYFGGDAIEVEGESYNYTIERKRGYADIVRKSKSRGIDLDEHDPSYRHLFRQRYSTNSGRLRAWNIDDAVASFIQAAKVGKVNWGCGNIDVRLPKNMPPKNLSLAAFISRGIKTIIYYIASIPTALMEFQSGLITTDDPFAFMMMSMLGLVMMGAMAVILRERDTPNRWIVPVGGGGFILYALGLSYARWKNGWEVKMS